MIVEIAITSDDGRDAIFTPMTGRLEIFDRPDEFGDVYGSSIFAGCTVVSADEDRGRITNEIAPGRYVEFTSSSGFVFEWWVTNVAVIVDGCTVWEGDETDG